MAPSKFDQFDHSKETWDSYTERLGQYFAANEVAADKQAAVLLSNMGPEAYQLLRTLLAPVLPSTKSYADIVKTMKDHLDPSPCEIGERWRFTRRNQHEGESIVSFVAALRKLSLYCKYGDGLSNALRDQFVFGLRNGSTQRRLLKDPNVTFDTAVEAAKLDETAAKDTVELQGGNLGATASANVHKLAPRSSNKKSGKDRCFRCNQTSHKSNDCWYKDAKCHGCGKVGHIKPACLAGGQGAKKKEKPTGKPPGKPWHNRKPRGRKVHQMAAASNDYSDEDEEWGNGMHSLQDAPDADQMHHLTKPRLRNDMIWVKVVRKQT